jgi:hypothetical protein
MDTGQSLQREIGTAPDGICSDADPDLTIEDDRLDPT